MILTLDLGTSATKALVWDLDGTRAAGRAALSTDFGPGGRVEQNGEAWWASVGRACDVARHSGRSVFDAVEAIALSSARQTFVPVDDDGRCVGLALVWSDRRASAQAKRLAGMLGGPAAAKARTGVPLDGGAVAAKVAWLADNEPERLTAARWLLSPRDLVVQALTGEVCTDPTLTSASGLYDASGALVPELAESVRDKLPPVRDSAEVAGALRDEPARRLGLRPGIPVVVGAGDRACEVLGTGADARHAMVSWGTTANVSVPVDDRPEVPPGLVVSRGARSSWLLEGGVSAAGSLLSLVARLTGTTETQLWSRARAVEPGAGGLVLLPWLGGARAPWFEDGARAGLVGLEADHGPSELARAALEAVAWDVGRCVTLALEATGGQRLEGLVLAGGGARERAWTDVLTGTTGLPAERRRSGESASCGAAMLGWQALGVDTALDALDPVSEELAVDAALADRYRALKPAADATAAAVVGLRPSASDGAG